MRWALVTSPGDRIGGVFARAFRAAEGPLPVAIYLLPSRAGLDFPGWAKPFVALRMLGLGGVYRLGSAGSLRALMHPGDKAAGLGEDFVAAMRGPDTEVVECVDAADFRYRLARLAPDLLVSVGAPIVFSAALLAVPRLGAVNVHNGQLPGYRGHFGSFWEVLEGQQSSATVLHRMAEKVDTGAVLDSAEIPLDAVESFLDLLISKKRHGGEMVARLLRQVEASGVLPEGIPMPAAHGPHRAFPGVLDGFRFRWPQPRTPRT